jgi:flavin-dependent dehydrogenase
MIDVLVVGGGPIGLATAICCARAGLSVAVAEPRPAPTDKACGEGLTPAAIGRLAALGVDPGGHPLLGIRYLDGRHRADALYRHRPGRGVRRTTLHAALSARAAELGISILPVRVTSFAQQAGHVTAAGVEARYLVGADGLQSRIRRCCVLGDESTGRSISFGLPGLASKRPRSGQARYGLRRHYRTAPWTDLVEVHWSAQAEAYVTPVADDLVGIGLLFAKTFRGGPLEDATRREAQRGGRIGSGRDFDAMLGAFPALLARLGGAAPASAVRGAGPLRQDVRRRVYGRVLLVGDASGYLDALTGEGIGVGLAQAEALARCLAAGRPADYERAWRRVSGPAWRLTGGLLWSRNRPLLAPRIVPAATHLPWLFSTLVNHAAEA